MGAIRKNKAKFWAIFSIITSKHTKKHHIEIIKINYLDKFLSPKTAEMAENGRFVGPRGPNYNPFFEFFANHFKIYKETPHEFIHCNIIQVQKTAKIAKNCYFL